MGNHGLAIDVDLALNDANLVTFELAKNTTCLTIPQGIMEDSSELGLSIPCSLELCHEFYG